jgi:transcriptional regulator with XRE-family HTH domain
MAAVRATHVHIGKKLRELRAKKGWTQEEAAELAGVSPRQLRRIETGSKEGQSPTIRTLEALARAYGVKLRDLLPNG